MTSEPKFPVTEYHMVQQWWPFWKPSRWQLVHEVYEDVEDLANDLEMIDTRDYPNLWLEDADGENWDVKLDILKGDIRDTQFFHRPTPKMTI